MDKANLTEKTSLFKLKSYRFFKFHAELSWSYALIFGIRFLASFLLFGLFSPLTYAEVQSFSNIQYDGAGNIVRMSSIDQFNPPNVDTIDPGIVNIGRTVSMTALGSDLFAVQITATTAGLSISNVNASQTLVTFDVSADQNAITGTANIIFTTNLGSDIESIMVTDPVPGLFTIPNPIAILANNQPSLIQLFFDLPRPAQEIYTLTIADPLTATLSVSSITVPVGASTAQFELSGITLGSTTLEVTLAEKLYFFSFPVYVTENFVADSNIFSAPLGVFLSTDIQAIENPLLSQSVGIFVQTDVQAIDNPLLSQSVGVFVQTDIQAIENPLLSQSVGIFVNDTQAINNPLLSPAVGVHTGPTISSYLPAIIQPGIQTDILFNGSDLDEVTEITIEPAGVITVDNFFAAADGTTLTVTVSADSLAPTGDYQMIITSVSGEVTLSQGVRAILSIP